jgi:hypothetical protein
MTGQRAKPGLSLGPVLMLALYFFWQMGAVPARAVNPRDPGPRFWPMSLAICLMAAGLATTAHAIAVRVRPSRQPAKQAPRDKRADSIGDDDEAPSPTNVSEWIRDWGVQNVALLLVALPAYVLAIPWLGYVVSTLLLSTIVMTRLGEPGVAAALERRALASARPTPVWKIWVLTLALSALVSIALVASIILLFDRVFDRPLPQGEFITLPF